MKKNCYDEVYLLSDGAGGQNERYVMLSFFPLLSRKLQIEITHLYPVRGHFYCSYDRNFGMYGKNKKIMKKIETVEDY